MPKPGPDGAIDEWLRRNASRLNTLDPDSGSDDDLEPLRRLIGEARMVLVGESMHRIHEFYLFRHRVFRFLARELGFTAFVMESGFPEGQTVNEWVHGGPGEGKKLLDAGLTYHMGKCQEMLDQVSWMREYNARHGGTLSFYGMDLPASSATALPGVEGCLPLLDHVDPPYAEVVRSRLLPLFGYLPEDNSGLAWAAPAIHAYLALDQAHRFELTARIGELVARIGAMRVDYAEQAGAEAVETALRCAESARQGDAFLAAMVTGPTRTYRPGNVRDAAMAENVGWILRREKRILVAAANGHVQRAPFLAPPFVSQGLTTMGQHLKASHGACQTGPGTQEPEPFVIGCSYGGGDAWLHRPRMDSKPGHSVPFVDDVGTSHPSSLDALLAESGPGPLLMDLRSVPDSGPVAERFSAVTATMQGPEKQLVDPLVGLDAAYFVDRISPWQTWIDADGLTPA